MRKSIAIDMDDVLADTLDRWVEVVNLCENENVKKEDIQTWDIHEYFKCGYKVYDYLTYDFFLNLKPKTNSQEVVEYLCKNYDVYIVTSATADDDIPTAKIKWIKKHYPFISLDRIVTCGDKSIIATDYLIDDGVHNLETFKGECVLFDAPHNQFNKKFTRVKDWEEIRYKFDIEFLKQVLNGVLEK